MKHANLYDPIYHAILNLKTHIYYDQITTLFLVSFYFVYKKKTKDYLFFTRKVIENFFFYTSIVESEGSESECLY